MTGKNRRFRASGWLFGMVATTMFAWSAAALAQTADAPADAPPPAPPPPAAVPEMTPPPPLPPPPPVAEAAKPPTATEAMPATRPEALPPIDVGAWLRVGGLFQNGSDPKKINDFRINSAYVELHAGGKIHKNVGVTLNLNANMTNFGGAKASVAMPNPSAVDQLGSPVSVMDAIISFDFDDAFHLWGGHLLVPVDRSNASGPFFMIPWNYPGLSGSPKEGPSGRNNGAVIWGDVAPAKLTYLVGVFDNGSVASSPLFSGRLRLSILDAETGFWGNGSYFGEKDLLTIGVGGQFQKHGSTDALGDKDWTEVNADLLFEKKIPGGGWVTAEGAYYHYGVNDGSISDSLYVLGAYATPTVGVGNIQPMVRYQWEKTKGDGSVSFWNLDAALSYLIKGPALRVVATYSHTKLGMDATANSIQLGAQAIFF